MVAGGLRAVVPEGVLVLNHEGEGVVGLTLLSGEVEAREDTVTAGKRLARLVE